MKFTLGVSIGTKKPTHPPKLLEPTQKLVDSTSVMVGDRFSPPKTDLRWVEW